MGQWGKSIAVAFDGGDMRNYLRAAVPNIVGNALNTALGKTMIT